MGLTDRLGEEEITFDEYINLIHKNWVTFVAKIKG